MSTQVITTPGGIEFAGFYYPEILRELLQFFRLNKERLGLTDENEYEIHIQFARAVAVVGHMNNTRLDTVATELLIDSAGLLESVKRLLRLVGIELHTASPAEADIIAKLSEVTSLDSVFFIPPLAEFATEGTPPVVYECLDGLDLSRTDQVGHLYGWQRTDSGTNGDVSSTASDIFRRTSGTWPADIAGSHLWIEASLYNNAGEFRIVSRLSDSDVRVVRVPGSEDPGFTTETTLSWRVGAFTADLASEANTPGTPFSPWSGTLYPGDAIYVSHPQVLPVKVGIDLNSFAGAITGAWEYYDGERSRFYPKTVTDLGSTLEFNLETLLGSQNRTGSIVTAVFLKTGAKYTGKSTYSSSNTLTVPNLLGQTTASIDPTDYHVYSDWVPFENVDDGSSTFTADGDVEWDLPENTERSWVERDVNLVDGWWFRFRVTVAGSPLPVFERIRIDGGDQFLKFVVTQGETVGPQVIGSSTGRPNQKIRVPDTPFFEDTETIEVDEGGAGNWIVYTRVESFLSSTATSRHYMREIDSKDQATIVFGDGTNGKIPPAGISNVRATYRIGGDTDGNVGAEQITSNSDGVTGISELWNPRSAYGWKLKDGGTDEDLERVKRDGPASLRVRGVAATADDVKRLALDSFTDRYGVNPVARAWAEEEKYGIKTVGLLVVGSGGTALSATQLSDLEEFFNGDRYARPPVAGRVVLNHKVFATNFEPNLVEVECTVVWRGGSAERVRNTILNYLNPLAVEEDGTTFIWDFGGQVSLSQVHALIHGIDPNVRDVPTLLLNGVEESINLGPNELPITLAGSVTVNIQEK